MCLHSEHEMWRLLALTFAVAHGEQITEDSDHNIHVFQKHSRPTSLRSNMLGNAMAKTLHVHGNLDVEGKLVHGDATLDISGLTKTVSQLDDEIIKLQENIAVLQIPDISGTGEYSVKMGQATASGIYSTAMGRATASGMFSTAMGEATASGVYSTAMGKGTLAQGAYSTALGAYNTNDTDALLSVGNGAGDNDRSTAFTVYADSIKIGSTVLTEQNVTDLLALLGGHGGPNQGGPYTGGPNTDGYDGSGGYDDTHGTDVTCVPGGPTPC